VTVEIMEGVSCWLILGKNVRAQFIHEFCRTTSATTKAVRASRAKPQNRKRVSSFKAAELKVEPEKPDSAG
jgi:hypothetical protein